MGAATTALALPLLQAAGAASEGYEQAKGAVAEVAERAAGAAKGAAKGAAAGAQGEQALPSSAISLPLRFVATCGHSHRLPEP